MRPNIVAAWVVVGGALIIASAGCAADERTNAGRPVVVATTTQLGSVASELGGDAIDLTVLLTPGVEAHDFELTPSQAAALERADLVLVSGAGLESWLDDTLSSTGAADRVRDMSAGIELRLAVEDEPTHDDEGPDPDEPQHAGEADPHYWLSGPNAIVMVGNVRDSLLEILADADAVGSRAEALIERLETADAQVRALISDIPESRRKIVTDHDALGYFIDEYGLEFVGSIFPTMDVSSAVSAQEVDALIAEIRAADVAAVFTESSVNPRIARAIADEGGARLVSEPIYTDSLGGAGSGAETLDEMLLHNARVIHEGLMGG